MRENTDHAVRVLNGLIKTTLDSVGGYEEAAENVDNAQYRAMFSERSTRRRRLASELQQQVESLGGEPETDPGVIGKLHNKFVDLKNTVTGGDDRAVIDEVERGEDYIRDKFRDALNDGDLPADVRSFVQQAYVGIKADHDEVSRIKHALH